MFLFFLIPAALLGLMTAEEVQLPRIPPRKPAEALSSFRIRPGFEMQLLAAEPLVTDPVAMVYDEDGRAFVAEMRDYPYTDKQADLPFTEKTADLPLGRIRLLEDTDADGVFDQSTVFAEDLSWPTGLAIWKGGVFVTATPDLWYLKDTNNDGKADVRVKLLTGFRKFNVQAVINNLTWGLDHRLYGAGSSNGGRIRAAVPGDGEPLVMATGDFRFEPHQVQATFELLSGGARFGNTFDDWGHRFICNIRNPIQQIVLQRHYLSRTAYAGYRSAVHDVALAGDTVPVWRSSAPEPWRVLNSRRLANDATIASPRSETVAAGYMTSASGVTIYRGDAYPSELYGTVFLGEVAGNLIHHQRLKKNGVAFTSERTQQESEFLASTDNWFRPVNFVNAPDGTLHVLDMYRETIEHPWSIPDDIKAQLDLESGRDRGRIYRLAPAGFQPTARPRLSTATTAELVQHLSNPKSWYRDTAHRLLYERQDETAVPLLRQLLNSADRQPVVISSATSAAADPDESVPRSDTAAAARLLALWSLKGINALNQRDLTIALSDPHPAIRVHGVALSEEYLSDDAELQYLVLQRAQDQDAEVRFQTALSLGELIVHDTAKSKSDVIRAVALIALRDAQDEFTKAAILSSSGNETVGLLAAMIQLAAANSWQQPEQEQRSAATTLIRELALIVGTRSKQPDINRLLEVVTGLSPEDNEEWLTAIALGIGQGLRRSNKSVTELLAMSDRPGAKILSAVFVRTTERLMNQNQTTEFTANEMTRMAELLAFAEYEQVRGLLMPWLNSDQNAAAQLTAVRVFAGHRQPEIPELLTSAYKALRTPARMEVIEALLSRTEWHPFLLTAAEAGTIPLFDIPYLRRNLLLRSRNDDVKQRSVKLFSATLAARREVVDRYRDQLPAIAANRERGEVVYRRECQICHRVGDAGQDLGPNLATIRHRAPDEVLLHILDPNREVAPNYIAQIVVTDEGQVLTGLVTDELPQQITLKLTTGTELRIARSKIEEISTTGQSLMPVGFEQRINVQEMADLLEFLLR